MGDKGIPSIGPGEPSRMIEAWGEALERKDPGTWSHCQRVAALAKILAQALGLDDAEIRVIVDGGLLHEIGRVAIPEAILRKLAKLTAEEMLIMRESSSRGYEMLRNVLSLAEAAEIVYAHRESFDGTGYPRGLKGEMIPLGARIVAVADALRCSLVIVLTTGSTDSQRHVGRFCIGQGASLILILSKCA
jgi:putative nucleotidyltransferase with HDIG domain